MTLIVSPGWLISGYGNKRVSISPYKKHILYYVTGGSWEQCAASVMSLFCSARWHDVVDGTVEVYGNRGINNAGGPLVVPLIHVFLSEWQGRNDKVISSATRKNGDMRLH